MVNLIIYIIAYIILLSVLNFYLSLHIQLCNDMINIDTILKEQRLTKTDVAKRMNLSRESLYRILSGNPTEENIRKLADALGVPVSRLFNDISGFIEIKGVIYRIDSKESLEDVLKLLQ